MTFFVLPLFGYMYYIYIYIYESIGLKYIKNILIKEIP